MSTGSNRDSQSAQVREFAQDSFQFRSRKTRRALAGATAAIVERLEARKLLSTTTVSLKPIDDALVRGGDFATRNYGSNPVLLSRESDIDNADRASYLAFNVTDPRNPGSTIDPSSVISVTLRIYGAQQTASGSSVPVTARGTETGWSEDQITYANRPAATTGGIASSEVTGTTPTWYELDVTSYVVQQLAAGQNLVSISLESLQNGPTAATFSSSESSFADPNMDVEFEDDQPGGGSNPTVDLSVSGTTESNEESLGGFVRANWDFDEGNLNELGDPASDDEPDAVAGDRINATDSDLLTGTLTVQGTGTWSLTFPANDINVWRETGGNWVKVESGVGYGPVTDATIHLRVEGILPSEAIRDVDLLATLQPSQGNALTDLVRLTVSDVDLLADSDNDDGYGRPWGTRTEAVAEDDATVTGKVIYVNDGDIDDDQIPDYADGFNRDFGSSLDDVTPGDRFVPLPLRIENPIDLSLARFPVHLFGIQPGVDVLVLDRAGGGSFAYLGRRWWCGAQQVIALLRWRLRRIGCNVHRRTAWAFTN